MSEQLSLFPRPVSLGSLPMAAPVEVPKRDVRGLIESEIAREEKLAGYARVNRAFAALRSESSDTSVSSTLADDYAARMMAYADDLGMYSGPSEGEELSDEDRAWAFSAHGEYAALCKERTGDVMPEDKLLKRQKASAELLDQSLRIVEKMREVPRVGWDGYRDMPFEIMRCYLHSGEVEKLPGFSRCCFIPYVAQALRAPMVASLEYWLSRNMFARFWTFSSGVRVQLSGVRDRAKWLAGKLNELNDADFMREAGVRMVFRSTELGTPETDANGSTLDGGEIERDETGQLYFHVHAHVVVELSKGFIPPEKWSALVGKVGKFWPAWWGEGGAIRNARECCKYVTKPGEMEKLAGWELCALREQLYRLKLVQPLGSLKEEIAARNEPGKRKRLVKRYTPDGRVYHVVRDWNAHSRRTRSEKAQDAAERLKRKDGDGSWRLLSRGTPRFGRSGVAEPVATVMVPRGSWNLDTLKAVRAHALIAPVIQATAHEYFAGVAIRVHTRTPTAGPLPEPPAWKPPRTNPGSVLTGRTPKY